MIQDAMNEIKRIVAARERKQAMLQANKRVTREWWEAILPKRIGIDDLKAAKDLTQENSTLVERLNANLKLAQWTA